MGQPARTLLTATVAIVSICLTAALAHAETASDEVVHDGLVQGWILERDINTLLFPQFRKPAPESVAALRRKPKATTLLQVDARIGEDSDLLFRVQAKRKKFLFLELRF